MIGQRFGLLVVTRDDPAEKYGGARAVALFCTLCGKEKLADRCKVKAGNVASCACQRSEKRKGKPTYIKHGQCWSPTYSSWAGMKDRCTNVNHKSFKDYGGRGVVVCARWNTFENFLQDMGERPEGTSIDRIDVNGAYEPGNCRWATALEQRANRRDCN